MCLRIFADDLRRSVDSHVENRGIYLSFPPSCRRATATARISSGIKFLVTNFVTFSESARERSKNRNGTRGIYTQWQHRRTTPDHCGRRAVLLIVLSCVSISMATGICAGPAFVEKIGAAPAAVIVRRGRPTG